MPMGNMFVVAALLTVVVVVAVDAKSVRSPDAKVLYYLNDDKLYRLKPPSLDAELIENGVLDYQLDGDAQPVWMDYGVHIYRAHGEPILSYKPSLYSARFALDHNTFYVVDGESQKMDVLQSDHKRVVLLEGPRIRLNEFVKKFQMIALDPSNGLMFILTDHHGTKNVYRYDMDATGKRKIAEGVSSDELVVDPHHRKVYWVNGKRGIVESIDYWGRKRQAINGLRGVTNETAIAVLDGEIYWSDNEGQINICKLLANSCDKSTLHHHKLPPSTNPIKYLKIADTSASKDSHACQPDNGGCQHMCLLNSRNESSCVCYIDWDSSGKECKPRRRRRGTPWYHYMTPQPTWKPQRNSQPLNPMANVPIPAIIGK